MGEGGRDENARGEQGAEGARGAGVTGAGRTGAGRAAVVLEVRLPFCPQLARYQRPGDLHVRPTPRLLDAYTDAVQAEARAAAPELGAGRVVAVRVTGDCPSLLGADRFERLVRGVRAAFSPAEDAEVGVDVLPGSLSAADLLAYRRCGVGRLVADVVADTPDQSARTGRFADVANMGATMRIVRAAHAEGMLDLRARYGLPRQTPGVWRRELAEALRWRPGQVELLPLEVEEGSAMWEESTARPDTGAQADPGTQGGAGAQADPGAQGGAAVTVASREDLAALADVAAEVLGGAGYERLAVPGGTEGADAAGFSQVWALPGRESALARARAAGADVLGLGVGATSRVDGFSYRNADDLDLYLARSADISAIARDVRRVG